MLSGCATAASPCRSRPLLQPPAPARRCPPPPPAFTPRLIPGAGAPRCARASPLPPGGGGDTGGLTGRATNPRAAQLPRGGGAGRAAGPASKAGGGGASGALGTSGPGRRRLRASRAALHPLLLPAGGGLEVLAGALGGPSLGPSFLPLDVSDSPAKRGFPGS